MTNKIKKQLIHKLKFIPPVIIDKELKKICVDKELCQIIHYRFCEHKKIKEIANIMHCTIITIKRRCDKALLILKNSRFFDRYRYFNDTF